MDSHQDSTIVQFLRAGVLLTALIAVPGTAICWNYIPKDIFGETMVPDSVSSPCIAEGECSDLLTEADRLGANFAENRSVGQEEHTSPLLESVLSDGMAEARIPAPPKLSMPQFDFPFTTADAGVIRRMSGEGSVDAERQISTDISAGHNVWAVDQRERVENDLTSEVARSQVPRRNFPSLERELKELGAKYYRLEKWGSRGEMFRFSCYVSPTDQHQYQKCFQAIDSDEIRVMEHVIGEIRLWKGPN